MSFRSRSRINVSNVLTRADHLFIQNYIRSFLNNIYFILYILNITYVKIYFNGPDGA